MPISIRARLTLTFTLAIAALLLVANVALNQYSYGSAKQRADQVLREGSKSEARSLREEWDEAEEDQNADASDTYPSLNTSQLIAASIRHTRQELSEDRVDVVVVEDRSGQIIRSDSGSPGLPWPLTEQNGWQYRVTHLAAPHHSTRYGTYTIVVGIPWFLTAAELQRQDSRVAKIGVIFVLLSAAGAWALVGYTLRPIAYLANQANSMRDTALGSAQRIQLRAPSADAEVVGLVRTLNLLIDGIADSADAKARFYTAASHELRTPLHVLCGKLELTLGQPRTADEYRAAMAEVQSQADRLATTIQSLLLLNRLDRGIPEAPSNRVDLPYLCSDLLAAFDTIITARRLDVQMESAPGYSALSTTITAPEMHAEIMIRNLIENAVKYAPEAGRILLSVTPATKEQPAALAVYNDADAIDAESFNRLFEPFYRPDDSRTARTGGNGLGLSICRALADADDWDLTLRQECSGVTARVAFGKVRA